MGRFLAIEAASGIVLIIAAIAALLWANSPWRTSYLNLWHLPIGIRLGSFAFERDSHFWINDGLMTIFFFVVGLEIRREIYAGALSSIRRAALPMAAAIGGMIVPAILFLILNTGRPSAAGWAIPIATDIAFAVGVLALLGKRVPPALRILLLALAIVDDVGAILVIALFYSDGLVLSGFALVGIGITTTIAMQIFGIRRPLAYVAPGIAIWAGTYMAGIHPTLSGVILGFMTPVRVWAGANRETVSPSERLLSLLHGWVAFGIMPLFAFANAGVPLGTISFEGDARWVFWGITIGLAIGKPLGVLGVSWLTSHIGAASLPIVVRWSHITIMGMAAGIGFTMALFIAQLAFTSGPLLETAKLAILCGSALSSVFALVVGFRFGRLESLRDAN